MKLIWLSDLHFSLDPLFGFDPSARLTAAIDHISAHHGDATHCVITGDLANNGDREAYQALRQHLGKLAMPVLPMMGNHDDRARMKDCLAVPSAGDFIQYSVETGAGVLICLDTHKIDDPAGEICGARLAWFEDALNTHRDRPVYLFMHHPPMKIEMPQHDPMLLEDGDAFLSLIARYPNVRHIFAGHVHRPISGNAGGISFTTMNSVLFQSPGPGPDWNWGDFLPVNEPPAYGVVHLLAGTTLVHFEQFCDASFGRI